MSFGVFDIVEVKAHGQPSSEVMRMGMNRRYHFDHLEAKTVFLNGNEEYVTNRGTTFCPLFLISDAQAKSIDCFLDCIQYVDVLAYNSVHAHSQ